MTSHLARAARWVVAIAVLGGTMFAFVPIADAHTDFESSTPADGAIVAQPVSEIRLRFTAASIVAGDGFVVLTPQGQVVQPEVQVSEDQREFTLLLNPALTDGVTGVQWSVRAGDAHPIEGTFSFTTPATLAVPDTAPSEPEPEFQPAAGSSGPAELSSGTGQQGQPAGQAEVSLEEFLNTENSSATAGPLGYLGRLASQAGSLVAIGVVGFALLVSRQEPHETPMLVFLIRQAAALTLLGAIMRAVALVIEVGSLSDALISSTGLAVGLRAAGAIALIIATGSTRPFSTQQPASTHQPAAQVSERALATVGGGSFSAAVGLPGSESAAAPGSVTATQSPSRIGTIEFWCGAVIALSFVFDGHTVTKGNHLLTGLVAVVHVVGGAVWLGGLICLVLLSRQRSNQGSDFVATVVRFSVVAAVALAAVGAAGLVLTVTILDSVSELWATAWGRILLSKVLIVAVAIAAGAFNHFVLVPEMQSMSAHNEARRSFVQTMIIELIALGCAVAMTAFLVAAAS